MRSKPQISSLSGESLPDYKGAKGLPFSPGNFERGKRRTADRLPPDFLSRLVAPVNLMPLSLKKAAHVVVDESS
jgi:hypothetical protein